MPQYKDSEILETEKNIIEFKGKFYFEDDSEFRIDAFDCVDNTGMYLGYSSINAFHSVVPSSVSAFYDYL